MFAVIKTGGKQYKVAEKDTIELQRLAGDVGESVAFGDVLAVGGDDGVTLGSPLVAGAQVAGEIVGHTRSATILVFKKRRRQNSKRSRGHRQEHTVVRITEILTDGKQPAKKAAAPKKTKTEAVPTAAVLESTAPAIEKPKRAPRKAAAGGEKPKAAKKPRARAKKE